MNQLLKDKKIDLQMFSFFSYNDKIAYYYFCVQQAQMWPASEIQYTKDKSDYDNKLTPRMRLLIDEILGFFAPGDGLVNASVVKQLSLAKNPMEVAFLLFQGAIEVVHQEVYGLFIKMFAKTPTREAEIFNMVNSIPCVKRKADFMVKYIDNEDIPDCIRKLAQACAEGIFFVTLFGIIFYFKRLNLLEAFIFANEQIQKDETTHRDYYCAKAEENGIKEHSKQAYEVIEEAISVETEYVQFLLRTPVQEGDLDKTTGLTVENFVAYIQQLADQILVFCGLEIRYHSKPNLSWMPDIGIEKKNNFYELKVGNYKKASLQTLLNWEDLIGMGDENKVLNGVEEPEKVDF